MLYRPNFCCHCGEKVARGKWLPWTSRRFCSFCEIEQMQHELLPKVGIGIALLVGAAGAVSYFAGSGVIETKADPSSQVRRVLPNEARELKTKTPEVTTIEPAPPSNSPTKLQREAPPNSSTESVYFCGAMTKKGTPCTRRLKSKGRCWQHAGHPLDENGAKPSRP